MPDVRLNDGVRLMGDYFSKVDNEYHKALRQMSYANWRSSVFGVWASERDSDDTKQALNPEFREAVARTIANHAETLNRLAETEKAECRSCFGRGVIWDGTDDYCCEGSFICTGCRPCPQCRPAE